jgi:hypothetical protein
VEGTVLLDRTNSGAPQEKVKTLSLATLHRESAALRTTGLQGGESRKPWLARCGWVGKDSSDDEAEPLSQNGTHIIACDMMVQLTTNV